MTRPWLLCLCLYGLLSSLAFSSSPRRFLQSPAPIDDENPPANTTTSSRFDDQIYRIEDELEYISILMMGYTYFGSWQTTPDKIPPGYSNPGGMALLATLYQTYDEILADFQFSLFIYDGDFIDQGIMRLNILQNISTITSDNYLPNSTLALTNTVVNLTYGDPLANMTSQSCNSNVTVQFLNKTSGEPFQPSFEFENDIFSFGLQLSIESQACGLSFNTSILNQDSIADQASSVVYTVLMSLAAILQCIACQYLITGLEEGHINVRKISLGSIRLINAFDFFLCLINLGRFMDNSLVVGFTAIPFAVLSLHFEFKLIVVVVTLQSRLTAMDTSKLNFSNCIWLLISMVSVIIGGVYGKPTFIYIVFSLTQMPQIIQNFLLQQRQRWNCCFLLTLTLPKIGYLAYMLTSSENIFRRSPNPGLFAAIMIILAMQFVVLLAQTRRPRLCKKEDVFYKFYDATDKETIGQDVCCICLEKLSSVATPQPDTNSPPPKDPKEASFLSSSTDVSINEGQKQTMVSTPCNHAFHESCLKEWVKQKLECPYCRCNLPEMPGEED